MADPKLIAALRIFARQSFGKVEIAGRSMRPLVCAGMVVEIEGLAHAAKIGDVLVFKSDAGLTAHRLIETGSPAGYITCGDATPESPEWVRASDVVGRVRAVWSGTDPKARRIDGPLFALAGIAMLRTRRLRAAARLTARALPVVATQPAGTPAFRALLASTIAFARLDYGLGLRSIASVPLDLFAEAARRHGMESFLRDSLVTARERGISVPQHLSDRFQPKHNASSAELVIEARHVSSILAQAGIEGVLLGEAARLCVDGDADGYDGSNDVGVLVPAHLADAAVSVLRGAGYDERLRTDTLATVRRYGFRRASLRADGRNVSVTVCYSLAAGGITSERLDYGAVVDRTRIVHSETGSVRVLTSVLDALGVAYGARDFAMLCDVAALMRRLVSLSAEDRIEFDRLVALERCDSVRLRSVVATADGLVRESVLPKGIARYLSWIVVREDLPRLLRNRTAFVDGLAAHVSRSRCAWATEKHGLLERLADVAAAPIVFRWQRWNTGRFGRGSASVGSAEQLKK